MSDSHLSHDASFDTSLGLTRKALDPEVLKSLEQQQGAEVGRGRLHPRIEIALAVRVRPCDAADRPQIELQGVSADLSRGGCRLILPLGTMVGGVYQIEVGTGDPRTTLVLARCLRCRMLREDAFEAAFSFFAPIDLPG